MPIMSAMDKNDARASARVLAVTTKRCLDGQLQPEDHLVELKSMFRFLRSYEAHQFSGHDFEQRSARGVEALSLRPTPDRHVGDLRDALEKALEEAFGGMDDEAAIGRIHCVIKTVAKKTQSDPDDQQRTSEFFDGFIQRLTAW